MSRKKAYLCGPMTGLPLDQTTGWRDEAKELLRGSFGRPGFDTLDPTRGLARVIGPKDVIGRDQSRHMVAEHTILQPEYFIERCYKDVEDCDVVLAHLLREPNGVGSFFELAWAYQMGKPIFAVRDPEYQLTSPRAYSPWVSHVLYGEGEELEPVCQAILEWN